MKERNYLYPKLIFILLILQFETTFTSYAQKSQTIRIAPEAARGGQVSDIFDSVSFIPLESTKESEFGEINQLIVTDKYYIILDNRTTNCILIFNKDGKFQTKISDWKGHVPNFLSNKPYISDGKWINYISYDNQNHVIEVKLYQNNDSTTYEFDLNGKLIKKIKKTWGESDQWLNLKNNDRIHLHSISKTYFKDKTIDAFNQIDIINHDSTINSFWPIDTAYPLIYNYSGQNYMANYGLTFYKDTVALLSFPGSYDVYEVTPNAIEKRYKFIFPENLYLPDSLRSIKAFSKYKIYKHPHIFSTKTIQVGNLLFIRAFDVRENDTYIYNLLNGSITNFSKIEPDKTSYFLKICDASEGGVNYSNKGFYLSDGKSIYTAYPGKYLSQQFGEEIAKSIKNNTPLKKFFASPKKFRNYVIVKLTPKSQN